MEASSRLRLIMSIVGFFLSIIIPQSPLHRLHLSCQWRRTHTFMAEIWCTECTVATYLKVLLVQPHTIDVLSLLLRHRINLRPREKLPVPRLEAMITWHGPLRISKTALETFIEDMAHSKNDARSTKSTSTWYVLSPSCLASILSSKYLQGCDQCAAKGIECDVGDTALRCGHCPAYVKCSRIATLKELRVIDIMDIPKEQYDCLLRWYQKDKEDELLEPLRDTFAKASMAVSHISESTAQPKLIKTRVQNPYPPSTSVRIREVLVLSRFLCW